MLTLRTGWPRWVLRVAILVLVILASSRMRDAPSYSGAVWSRALLNIGIATALDCFVGWICSLAGERVSPERAAAHPGLRVEDGGETPVAAAANNRVITCVIGCRAAGVAAYLALLGVNHDIAALVLGLVFGLSFLIIRCGPAAFRRSGLVHSFTVVVALSLVCAWGGVLVQNVAGIPLETLAEEGRDGVEVQLRSPPYTPRIEIELGFPVRGVRGQHLGGSFGSDFVGAARLAWERGLPVFWLNWLIPAVVAGLFVWRLSGFWIRTIHPWAVFAAVVSVLAGRAWLEVWGEPAGFGS